MKAFNIIFLVLFVLFAALQYNDPDPHLWIPIYLFAAFLCYLAYNNKYTPSLFGGAILACVAYATYLFFTTAGVLDWLNIYQRENIVQTMKAEKPYIEMTREFGGLALIIIVLAINIIQSRKQAGKRG